MQNAQWDAHGEERGLRDENTARMVFGRDAGGVGVRGSGVGGGCATVLCDPGAGVRGGCGVVPLRGEGRGCGRADCVVGVGLRRGRDGRPEGDGGGGHRRDVVRGVRRERRGGGRVPARAAAADGGDDEREDAGPEGNDGRPLRAGRGNEDGAGNPPLQRADGGAVGGFFGRAAPDGAGNIDGDGNGSVLRRCGVVAGRANRQLQVGLRGRGTGERDEGERDARLCVEGIVRRDADGGVRAGQRQVGDEHAERDEGGVYRGRGRQGGAFAGTGIPEGVPGGVHLERHRKGVQRARRGREGAGGPLCVLPPP